LGDPAAVIFKKLVQLVHRPQAYHADSPAHPICPLDSEMV
jgi:hypothetical protein